MAPTGTGTAGSALAHSAAARAPDGARPVLTIRALRKRFGGVRVLDGVDLDVMPDELVALVGENGTGKSTLVRCLAGALPADEGSIEVAGEPVTAEHTVAGQSIEVVWQDLSLCGNLDVVDNLFLGRESGWRLRPRDDLRVRAQDLLGELGVRLPDLGVAVAQLSGGQQQSVALARTLLGDPTLLVLDEPTAALGATGARAVHRLLRRARAGGVAILLISHDLDLVCQVADRALVLRGGRIVDDVRRPRLTPDVLKVSITGLEPDGAAREQLHGLHSLVDQLSDVEPSAVVPLIVSALSLAVEHDGIVVHLRDADGTADVLELAAALGLPLGATDPLSGIASEGPAPMAHALREHRPVVVADLRLSDWDRSAQLLRRGVRSLWTVPIVVGDRALGTVTGLGEAIGPVADDVVELATLYASHAAAALERDRLLGDLTRRNATLETLRQMLETLAGPVGDDAGLAIALDALRIGLDADDVALLDAGVPPDDPGRLRQVAGDASWARSLAPPPPGTSATLRDDHGRVVLAATVPEEDHRYALVARWPHGDTPRPGARELLTDGVRGVRLALERRTLEDARQEAVALRRSHALQRTFLSRLSHELRTPLTAIHGCADTLRQPDVDWDHGSTRQFLDTIARESGRLGELVTDLLDASSIEAGVLHLQLDWCELALVVEAALASVPTSGGTSVVVDPGADDLPPVRADHDRLEQVLVNLVGNAVHHTPAGTTVSVLLRRPDHDTVTIAVVDDGPGLPVEVTDALFTPGARGRGAGTGSGLGLAICRGIAEAHGGTVELLATSTSGTCFQLSLPIEGPTPDTPGWAPGAIGRPNGAQA